MHSSIEQQGLLRFIKKESLPFFISLTIAELAFRFGSFTLECFSFLLTWYFTGKIIHTIQRALRSKENKSLDKEKRDTPGLTVP